VNLEFWIIASPVMHTSSGAINFISDSHASRYNFETSQGTLRIIPERCPTKASVRVTGLLVTVLYPRIETRQNSRGFCNLQKGGDPPSDLE
jgi:hypothetical protein